MTRQAKQVALTEAIRSHVPGVERLPATAHDLLELARTHQLPVGTAAALLDCFVEARKADVAAAIGSDPGTSQSAARRSALLGSGPGTTTRTHGSFLQRMFTRTPGTGYTFDRLAAALARGDRIATRLVDGPPVRPGQVPDAVRPSPMVKPADWLRRAGLPDELCEGPVAALHRDFVERNRFENFDMSSLSALAGRLERGLEAHPTGSTANALRFELATVLMQNRPTPESLGRAKELLASIEPDLSALPPPYATAAGEIATAVELMHARPRNPDTVVSQVNFKVNNRCPMVCRGCYNIFSEKPLQLSHFLTIVDKLAAAGVKELVVSGGDPLLWAPLVPFLAYVKEKGLAVSLDTTGLTMTADLARALAGKVHYVGLPLDGATEESVRLFRRSQLDVLAGVRKAMHLLVQAGVKVKINTVVHRRNVQELPLIASEIDALPKDAVWGWSVFEWWDLRADERLRADMQVDLAAYHRAGAALTAAYPHLPVWLGSRDARAFTYFMVTESGEVHTFGNSAHTGTVILGNVLHEPVQSLFSSPALANEDNPKLAPMISKASL